MTADTLLPPLPVACQRIAVCFQTMDIVPLSLMVEDDMHRCKSIQKDEAVRCELMQVVPLGAFHRPGAVRQQPLQRVLRIEDR